MNADEHRWTRIDNRAIILRSMNSITVKAIGAVLLAVFIFAIEAVTLRTAGKHGLPMGPIAVTQCFVAALVQFAFGARFSRIDWKRWWPALLTSTFAGLSFYIAIRIAPAALVGLIEPLGLVPLVAGHRLILQKRITTGSAIAIFMLILASITTVGQWPESIGWLAIGISFIGIICSGLSLVTGESVSADGLPSFVLAMQTILMVFSAIIGISLESTSLAGEQGMWLAAMCVGAGTGLIVGLAVTSLYYGVAHLGALRAGSIKMIRLPAIALLAYFVIQESASIVSAIALSMVVIFSILAVRLSNTSDIHENIPAGR
jgi:drug/metabolite transporter (DMT)-like permease